MRISQFDGMSKKDQARYATELLDYSVRMLWSQKRDADAQKVMDLFKKKSEEKISEGAQDLLSILATLRKTPAETPYHVEHAFAVTLRRHGVELSPTDMKELVQITKNFKPSDTLNAADSK